MFERYLYHSFPRRGTQDCEKGLAILRSIISDGLLLVPEVTSFEFGPGYSSRIGGFFGGPLKELQILTRADNT